MFLREKTFLKYATVIVVIQGVRTCQIRLRPEMICNVIKL